MDVVQVLLRVQRKSVIGAVARQVSLALGFDIPRSVEIGDDFLISHRALGVVIHPRTTIGNHVSLYHGVTIGGGPVGGAPGRTYIGDFAVITAGAVVLRTRGDRTIGEGAIVGANAVVNTDVPPWEIWAGNPAKKIGDRERDPFAWRQERWTERQRDAR